MFRRARAWVMVVCVCSGCSLLGLGDFDLEECTETPNGPRCEVLNQARGVPDSACYRYQCRREGPGCELRPKDSDNDGKADERLCASEVAGDLDCDDGDPDRAPNKQEVCDGKDNNCDGYVDEQLEPLPAETAFTFATGTDLRSVEALQVDDRSVYVLGGESRERDWKQHLLVFERGGLTPRSSEEHELEITLTDRDGVNGPGACLKLRDGERQGNACGFEEVVLTALGGSGTSLITAGVDRGSSSFGVLRAGVLVSAQSSSQLRLGSAGLGSSLDLGIGLPRLGARLPRLIAGSASEALLVWQTLGRSADDAPCARRALDACDDLAADSCSGGTDILALGIGAHRVGDTLALDALGVVDGERIGSGTAAPAIATLNVPNLESYLVAYAAESGVELYSRPWFSSTSARRTLRGALPTVGPVTGIALGTASLLSQESFRPAAAVWRTGCKERSSIQLARLELHPDQAEWGASTTAPLGIGASVVGGPWIAHTQSGLRQPKQADAASTGGWFVIWLEERSADQRALMLRRVAEVDGEPVGEAVELAVGSIRFAFLFTSASGAIRYGYVERFDHGSTTLRTGEAGCAPPAR